MGSNAYQILGIEPTRDGRAIRAAFLRLARIYHPDRFAGQPDEVRLEAERRMKEATAAYDSLRVRGERSPDSAATKVDEAELAERTKTYRAAIETRKAEEERNRARWRRWDQIERETRERAERNAHIAAEVERQISGEAIYHVTVTEREPASAAPSTSAPSRPDGALRERLEAARRGVKASLVRRGEVSA